MFEIWGPLAVGLILLVAGGDLIVRGAVQAAERLGVSPLVIGLTLVGFGTSMPELVTSVQAGLIGSPGIAYGNIVGSNIANILLIAGCRVALKSETRRFRHRVLPLIARFGCHGAFASRPPLCNVTNCGKQTWHRSPTLLLSTEGNRVFAIIFHRHLQHKSLTPVSGLRAKISELRAKSHI